MLEDQDPFKKILLKQERCFFSLGHVVSSKLGPLGTKSGALDSIVQAPILAPPLRCIIWGKLINFKPPFFLLQNGSNGGTQLISLCRLGVVIEIKCLAYTKHSTSVSYYWQYLWPHHYGWLMILSWSFLLLGLLKAVSTTAQELLQWSALGRMSAVKPLFLRLLLWYLLEPCWQPSEHFLGTPSNQ